MTTRSIGWQSARRFLLLVLGVGILIALLYQHSQEGGRRGVGIQQLKSTNPGHLSMAVFYPARGGGEFSKAGGFEVYGVNDAEPAAGRFPVIVVAHGSYASAYAHHDTASYLSLSGFIVLAIEHNVSADTAELRAREVSLALDVLLKSPLADLVDKERIGIIGHELGAEAAMLLIGNAALEDDTGCDTPSGCDARYHLWDKRIRAALLLSPPETVGTRKDAAVTIPLGVIHAGAGNGRILEQASNGLRSHPASLMLLERVPLASSNVFLPPCEEPLKSERKDLCVDHPLVDRQQVHALLNGLAVSFFYNALP